MAGLLLAALLEAQSWQLHFPEVPAHWIAKEAPKEDLSLSLLCLKYLQIKYSFQFWDP